MKSNLYWEKNILSDNYKIYLNSELIGKLEDHPFSQSTTGTINENKYTFRKIGFLQQHIDIIDNFSNKIIGKIIFDKMMTKALISLDHQSFVWNYDNLWCTQWKVLNSERQRINYSSSLAKGQIESEIDNRLLILTGLYVKNYHWKITCMILIIVILPILFM